MKIAGFKKQSLIDYPGNISSVVFTQGCNFRCPYCHNPDLVLPDKFGSCYKESELFAYWQKYQHLLDAVCITGGEPCIHNDLPDFIRKIKNMGLKVKLDTNGTYPNQIKYLTENKLIDSIAMDIKHVLDFESYRQGVGYALSTIGFKNVMESIGLIENSGIAYEFRTTIVKGLHKIDQINSLKKRFNQHYKIQNYNPEITLNDNPEFEPFSKSELEAIKL
ncbi:anaerobic ribonucleoside-triphosphate reductase activating protein [Ancylomarina salipaludis]|uniref:Anaerobic ribonucleoside-triphosphate reductase activating protein n=1 Tax=Ancylomarina salipaludis TaxID=2501299 RepID=A0A4V1N099_9BACT|nr:anaerobic ribonucleoside-triphosphate reductase activating protein [Ancylomarina salipaludis]RXQ95843.1 anaerobic ribonucleoside-triphosphate reductase activating protein [Ancylomarina salipaludis]